VVIREWRGRASPSRMDAYPRHFRDNVIPALRELPGFAGAHLSWHAFGDNVEFLVLTLWQSMDAIRDFAGHDVEKAVVEPAAVAALLDFDSDVYHYEVIENVLPVAPAIS
jgi:heme-degrading monooxygenase HmoA